MKRLVFNWYWPSTLYSVLLIVFGGAVAHGHWLFAFLLFVVSVIVDSVYNCLRNRR